MGIIGGWFKVVKMMKVRLPLESKNPGALATQKLDLNWSQLLRPSGKAYKETI